MAISNVVVEKQLPAFRLKAKRYKRNSHACPWNEYRRGVLPEGSPWMDFAKRNNLGVIALNYSSSEEDLYQNRKGYYWLEQGSRQVLLNEIKRVYGKDLPIVLYGFSGGAQFVSRFVDWRPDRIIAWCAYSAQFWDYPPKGSKLTKARGIYVAQYFRQLR